MGYDSHNIEDVAGIYSTVIIYDHYTIIEDNYDMKSNTTKTTLDHINHQRQELYDGYRAGEMDEKEYLRLIKPLDEAAERIEMACLSGSHLLEKAFAKRHRKA
jgi:hypothetical protein